jgi:hypothetical protein
MAAQGQEEQEREEPEQEGREQEEPEPEGREGQSRWEAGWEWCMCICECVRIDGSRLQGEADTHGQSVMVNVLFSVTVYVLVPMVTSVGKGQ